MIKLNKQEEPAILRQNWQAWTKALVEKLAAGQKPTKAEKSRYGHPEIKAALVQETHGKCAYCESKVRHITYGDIEHVSPKSADPNVWFKWSNLTLACDVCNTNKSDFIGDHDTFIDPYAVDPEEHFWPLGPVMQPKPGCNAASITERVIMLNRPDLVERRRERLSGLMKILEVIERVKDPALREILLLDLDEETKSDKEYAALAREIARLAKAKLGHQNPSLA